MSGSKSISDGTFKPVNSQVKFRHSQIKFRYMSAVLRQYWRIFSHNFSKLSFAPFLAYQDLAKRRFSRHRENLCEKNDAAPEAGSARAAKSYVIKTAYLLFFSDSNEAAKRFGSAWKSYVRIVQVTHSIWISFTSPCAASLGKFI